MRAARLHELGGTPTVDQVDALTDPRAVDVRMAALNPIDISISTGRFYGGTPGLPYVVGCEAVGLDAAGERFWLYGRNGLLAERALPPDWCFAVPAGVADELALACGVSGLTAWLALTWRARVEPDDTVLVLGASGTLGATALQAAKLLGARRVIGAARRTANVPDCADELVDLAATGEFPAATLIVDALWGEPLERALAAAPAGVRVVQLGQSAAPAATLLSAWVRGKVATILGHTLHAAPLEVARRGYAELCGHARDGSIAFAIERYAFAELALAWQAQASSSPGAKIVVELG